MFAQLAQDNDGYFTCGLPKPTENGRQFSMMLAES